VLYERGKSVKSANSQKRRVQETETEKARSEVPKERRGTSLLHSPGLLVEGGLRSNSNKILLKKGERKEHGELRKQIGIKKEAAGERRMKGAASTRKWEKRRRIFGGEGWITTLSTETIKKAQGGKIDVGQSCRKKKTRRCLWSREGKGEKTCRKRTSNSLLKRSKEHKGELVIDFSGGKKNTMRETKQLGSSRERTRGQTMSRMKQGKRNL